MMTSSCGGKSLGCSLYLEIKSCREFANTTTKTELGVKGVVNAPPNNAITSLLIRLASQSLHPLRMAIILHIDLGLNLGGNHSIFFAHLLQKV
jgi:hypothetical protein